MSDLEKLKFPIGAFVQPIHYSNEQMSTFIDDISEFPELLRNETFHLSDLQLDTPYRLGGWTIRQVVHHCADSHMNSFIRFKLALTEDKPIIKPYWEDRWAELVDSKTLEVESSLSLLNSLHVRWAVLLKSLTDSQFLRTFIHPEHGREISLQENTAFYS